MNWCLLTEPVPKRWRQQAAWLRRRLRGSGRTKSALGGHPSVTSSLVRGLRRLNQKFCLNPYFIDNVGPVCIVLSSLDALRQAIELKRRGVIKFLLAGPNLVVRSNEHERIIASPEVDLCIVPSKWVAQAYEEDAPTLAGRIRVWFAGVDETYWTPTRNVEGRNISLVYWKNAGTALAEHVETRLSDAGWAVRRVIYGKYRPDEYRAALAESRFAVFLSRSESQGLALAEAWAMDVPTLAWEPKELVIGGRRYSEFSASPYMNPQVGVRWSCEAEFGELLRSLPGVLSRYSPRRWVQENMTDECSAKLMMKYVDELILRRN